MIQTIYNSGMAFYNKIAISRKLNQLYHKEMSTMRGGGG